jgi:uncharacterized membrane protein required for colicin V production
MILWFTVLASGIFVWLGIKIGFYEIIILLFNILISVYLAIFLTPVVTEIILATVYTEYNTVMAMTVIAAATFLILYGITYVFLTGQFKVPMPKMFDFLFAGVIGFLTGFLVLSFIVLLIYVSPLSQSNFLEKIGFGRQVQEHNISYICKLCNPVNLVVASKENNVTNREAIEKLLTCAKPRSQPEKTKNDEL